MKNTNYSVKKHQTYLVLLLALLFSGTITAKVNNYVGAYGELGEWTFLPSGSKYGASFGIAGGAGFLYELQAGPTYGQTRFLFDLGIGAQGGMTAFMQGSNMLVELPDQTDLDGETFNYIYEVQDRHDTYNSLAVKMPILIGLQHKKFYMLAGVKLNANVLTKAHTTANINTFGRYFDENNVQMFDDFCNMPDYQFFSNYKLNGKANAALNLGIDLSFEIGGRLGVINSAVGYDVPKRKIEYRLAGFVDYGLLDIHKADTKDGFTAPSSYNAREAYNKTTMVDNLQVNDLMSTTDFASKVNNLMIGLKFTILFQLPEPGECVICRDAYRSTVRSRGGRLKYEE
ncbi:MAG: hypothetical protein II825_02690 [Paludibacteraceae bacterium]|nr:hypothetical protein [Paludibacteraceae bacterium]